MKIERNTVQKQLVEDIVLKMRSHPTAEEVYLEIQKQYPSISRATAYRNLNLLDKSGKVKRVELANSADRFDYKTKRHYHIQCRVCGKVVDADLPYLEGLKQQVSGQQGFLVDDYDIVFKGVCPECNK